MGQRPPRRRSAGADRRRGPGRHLGVVTVAGTVAGKPVVAVALPGGGSRVTYEPVVARVRVGVPVRSGDILGVLAAAGGHCGGTAGCLHLGLRTPTGYRDPLALIERTPAVLKPR